MAKNNSVNNASGSLTVDPGASGDSFVQFDINGTGEFRIGVDDDASDAFKISQGSALGTSDTFVMTAAGERTMPLQPAFHSYLGTTDNNATGDGTQFVLGSGNTLTEVFDQGGDFTTAGIFTAPITGRYLFTMCVMTDNTTSSHTTWQPQCATSNNTFNFAYQSGFANVAAGDFLSGNGSVICEMEAADTADFRIVVSGGTKVVEVNAGAGLTYVSGALYC